MREHKYKAKRKDNGEWVFGFYAETYTYGSPEPEIPQDKHCWITEYCEDCRASFERHEVDPDTVGQFTGEYCYNDREIFDGDITSLDGTMRVETVRRVVWKDGGFCMVGLGGSKANAYLSLFKISGRLKKTVIIGNIHDNTELLEEAK